MRTNIQNLPLLAEYRGLYIEIIQFNEEPPRYHKKIMLIYLFILQ